MSKLNNRDVSSNVPFNSRSSGSGNVKCVNRFYETRTGGTLFNRCKISVTGRCLYKNHSQNTCPIVNK